ncbi:hypothetical protein GS934_17525 [Rhodococcus hoagii]|nr:hypothetical protein [Prescottella equi]NKZ88220.1 hypothetical protein [Prescottella equi]
MFVGSGIFKSGNPAERAAAIVKATTFFDDPDVLAKVSRGLGEAMSASTSTTSRSLTGSPSAAGDPRTTRGRCAPPTRSARGSSSEPFVLRSPSTRQQALHLCDGGFEVRGLYRVREFGQAEEAEHVGQPRSQAAEVQSLASPSAN